jgi:HSP20 family protein
MSPRGSLHDLDAFRQEMNSLMDWAFGRGWTDGLLESSWTPPVDVEQEADKFRIHVDLPGVQRDEIEITVHGETLTVKGEKKREIESKQDDTYRSERYYGTFSRSLTLPAAVDANKIEASYKDGVLEIVVPKSEEAKPRQIKIQG